MNVFGLGNLLRGLAIGAAVLAVTNGLTAYYARQNAAQAAELSAIYATLTELERQSESVRLATENLQQALSDVRAHNDAVRERLEQNIADYETSRLVENRGCPLSGADVDWLRSQ